MVGTDLTVVSAADLEKYGYCPLSWWRSLDEQAAQAPRAPTPPDSARQLAAGQQAHAQAGADLLEIRTGEQLVADSNEFIWRFSAVATGLALFGFILTFLGLELWRISLIPIAISLVWLLMALVFFRVSIHYFLLVKSRREKVGVQADAVVYVGEGTTVDEDPALFSHRLGLVGAPDSIVEREGHFIPIEIKTGRVPKGPLFSHILQLAAYSALVEDKYGKAPPYGLLKYGPQVEYEIEYNDDQRRLLEDKLAEMRRAMKTGDVHRNHHRPGKCANCSRREGCPERLDKPVPGASATASAR
jgi:CRISPR-associated exonuclease Cas4